MAKSIFEVGDTVTIKERVHSEGAYRCGFTDTMAEMAGEQFVIERVREGSGSRYKLPDDGFVYDLRGNHFNWSSSMFEVPGECSTLCSTEGLDNESIKPFVRKKKCPELDFTL